MKMKKTWGFMVMLAVMALGLASCGNDAVGMDESVNKGEPTEIKIKISLPSDMTRSDGSLINNIEGSIVKITDGNTTFISPISITGDEERTVLFSGYSLEQYKIYIYGMNEKSGMYVSNAAFIESNSSGSYVFDERKDCFYAFQEFSGMDNEVSVEMIRFSSRINILTTQTDKSKIKFDNMEVTAVFPNGMSIEGNISYNNTSARKHNFENNPQLYEIDGTEYMLLGYIYLLPTFRNTSFTINIDDRITSKINLYVDRNSTYNLIGDFFTNNVETNTTVNIGLNTKYDNTYSEDLVVEYK